VPPAATNLLAVLRWFYIVYRTMRGDAELETPSVVSWTTARRFLSAFFFNIFGTERGKERQSSSLPFLLASPPRA